MNHPAVSAARPASLAVPAASGIRYAANEAHRAFLAHHLPAALKCAAAAASQAAKAAERKAARQAARVVAAHAEAAKVKTAAQAAFDAEWSALLSEEERENAAKAASLYWVTGEGKRPTLSAVTESTWSVMVVGLPRRTLTARNRPGFGADGNPAIGQGSRTRPGQNVGLAHEASAERPYAVTYNATAPVGL